jgi:hypothetical protein
MKTFPSKWILSLSFLWLFASFAVGAAPLQKTPNYYSVQGGNLTITYATTSINGQPTFTYQDTNQSITFTGDQIRTVGTEIGTLVTVTTAMTVDAGSTTFTLLIPRVALDASNQAALRTKGITTHHKFSLIPSLNVGQRDTYKVTALTGTASFLVF